MAQLYYRHPIVSLAILAYPIGFDVYKRQSLVSTLTGTPVRCDTAMTGELTLTGRVLPIGGLREKSTAAWNAGIKRVLIPADNLPDLEEIDPVVRAALLFIPVHKGAEVLQLSLIHI